MTWITQVCPLEVGRSVTIELTRGVLQASKPNLCTAVMHNAMLVTSADDRDFYFVPADDPETAVLRIIELVKTRIPQRFGLDPTRDIQVLCPMNRAGLGAELWPKLGDGGLRKAAYRGGWKPT